jgi:hypothetical protein
MLSLGLALPTELTLLRSPLTRVTLRAVFRVAFLLGLVLLFAGHFVGCAPTCNGVDNNGRCETTCHDDACETGSKCVDNACRPACGAQSDCGVGERCEKRITDYGTSGKSYCISQTPHSTSTKGTDGAHCASSADCAENYGYRCIGSTCTLTCEIHGQCGTRGSCTGTARDAEGRTAHTCEPDDVPRAPGQYGTSCPKGDECDTAHDFRCVSAAPGDIDAYCTKRFCANDGDCPSGSFCSERLARQPPCADTCGGLPGDSTVADCVGASDIGLGKHFRCGPVALVTTSCLHREFCNTCDSDVDCLGKPNQVCAKDESGEKICTVLCDLDLNSCPWGNAASCGVWDTALRVATCEHRSGSCHGKGKSCEPCVDQTDCPDGWCSEAQFTGERYCVDTTVSCSCPSGTTGTCGGGGCPTTPGGREMNCWGGTAYEGSPGFDQCVGAVADSTERASKESCWPRL